jgi:hypothetical protein
MKKVIQFWRKKLLLSTSYGHDTITPMSPSTLKIERHDPGGLYYWQDLAEIGINILFFSATIWLASLINPAYAVIWTIVCVTAFAVTNLDLRFKFFTPRPKTVSIRYIPAEIPISLIKRYEQASSELRRVMLELEEIAAENGIRPNDGLRRWAKEGSE